MQSKNCWRKFRFINTLKGDFCRNILLENEFKRRVDLSPHGHASGIPPLSGRVMDSVSFFMNFVQWFTKVHVIVTVIAMEVLIKYCINSFLKLTNSFDRNLINFL